MRAGYVLLPLAVGAALLRILAACNAIVGVEDVKLKKDGADDDVDIVVEQDGDTPIEDQTSPPTNVFELAVGEEHTCGKKAEGTVKCWGHDDRSQTGTAGVDGGVVMTPLDVTGVSDALHITAGAGHTCILRTSGKISCWGDGISGQLGNGQNGRSRDPVDVAGISSAKAVEAGATFTCAVRSDGAVLCWGLGDSGQLGNNAKGNSATPVAVQGVTGAIGVSAGEVHACAVTTGGNVFCWGNNTNGQLGTGSTGTESLTAVQVPALDGITQVATTGRSTCALRNNGEVYCWGANDVGQLGSGAANATPNPSPSLLNGVSASVISTGKDHVCAVRKAGGVACWGDSSRGQLGNGSVGIKAMPTEVNGLTAAATVAAGGLTSCAGLKTGQVQCWGAGNFGQLGENKVIDEPTPVSVIGYP